MAYKVGDILVNDFFTRVTNKCHNNAEFTMENLSLLSIIRFKLRDIFSIASMSLRSEFQVLDTISVTTSWQSAGFKALSLTDKNYFDVIGISYGATKAYIEATNWKEFIRIQASTAKEHTGGRYYYNTKGGGEILIFNGSDITTPDTECVLDVVRYPDLSMFTETNIDVNSTEKMDWPTWLGGYTAAACAVEALKEKGLAVPGDLNNEVDRAISAVSDKVSQDEIAALKLNKDTVRGG